MLRRLFTIASLGVLVACGTRNESLVGIAEGYAERAVSGADFSMIDDDRLFASRRGMEDTKLTRVIERVRFAFAGSGAEAADRGAFGNWGLESR